VTVFAQVVTSETFIPTEVAPGGTVTDMNVPELLRYTSEHEWVQVFDGGSRVRIGITDFAQDALGDVVYVDLPESGASIKASESIGELESTKSVSDVYAPVSGTVTVVNELLADQPELLNSDPYGEGWLLEIDADDLADLDGLLDEAAYRALTEG
jgi:glycine cleavage system H protein